MHVEFLIAHERAPICAWSARVGRHTVPGTVMATGSSLPHDSQCVIEAASRNELGFWGLLAKGATYKSTKQRITKPGRAVIVRHRPELDESERLAGTTTDRRVEMRTFVADVSAAREELIAARVEVDEPAENEAQRYVHFVAPDGELYELVEDLRPEAAPGTP